MLNIPMVFVVEMNYNLECFTLTVALTDKHEYRILMMCCDGQKSALAHSITTNAKGLSIYF